MHVVAFRSHLENSMRTFEIFDVELILPPTQAFFVSKLPTIATPHSCVVNSQLSAAILRPLISTAFINEMLLDFRGFSPCYI
jgi:hypothetical protein